MDPVTRVGALALILIAMCGLGVVAASGVADAKTPKATTLERSGDLARFYWASKGTPVECDELHFEFFQDPKDSVLGWSYIGPYDCTIRVNTHVNWREYGSFFWPVRNGQEIVCALIVHEAGHIAGRHHERVGIMRAELDNVPRICKVAF